MILKNYSITLPSYSSSDITVALSRALDYTKKYASKYNPLTVKLSRGNYNVKNTLFLTSYTTIDLNASLIKNANFKRGNIFKSPEDKAYEKKTHKINTAHIKKEVNLFFKMSPPHIPYYF